MGLPLSPALSPEGERENLAALAYRAAQLCKADLVTGMVGEFPELQGLMGGYYAAAQGEDPRVAAAIRDHYKPVGQGDDVPTDPVTVAVSLADKLDTIAQFFSIDLPPTGSKDPFALRRAALGIIALLKSSDIRLSVVLAAVHLVTARLVPLKLEADRQPLLQAVKAITDLITKNNAPHFLKAVVATVEDMPDPRGFDTDQFKSILKISAAVRDFLLDRLEYAEREAGIRPDIIRAAQIIDGDVGKEDDLVRLLARVHALQAFIGTEDGVNLLAGYKRAANILKKEDFTPAGAPAKAGALASEHDASDPALRPSPEHGAQKALSYTPEPAEAALALALDSAEPAAAAAVAREDFEAAMAALATLRAPIDAFFEGVIVNDPVPEKRAARLALLDRVRAAVHNVADFSKIEG